MASDRTKTAKFKRHLALSPRLNYGDQPVVAVPYGQTQCATPKAEEMAFRDVQSILY
jgi:hypothetical protein